MFYCISKDEKGKSHNAISCLFYRKRHSLFHSPSDICLFFALINIEQTMCHERAYAKICLNVRHDWYYFIKQEWFR